MYRGNEIGDNITFSVIANLSLILRYTTGNYNGTYDDSRHFTVNINNYRKVRRCFEMAVRWFEDPEFSDLYYYNEDRLEFNMDRNDVKQVLQMSKRSRHSLEIRPVIIENNMGRMEGISLTINRTENTVMLDWEDFIVLADIVLNFDFRNEALLLLQAFQIGSQLENICTPQEMKIARNINSGQRVDPFKNS
jgi:hypothetical protein